MKTVADALTSIHTAIKQKGQADTTSAEKHGLVLYHYALHQVNRDGKNRVQVAAELERLIDEMLLDGTAAPDTLSLPIIPDLYREGLVTASLHTRIGQLDHYLYYKATLLLGDPNRGAVRGVLGIVHYFVERLPNAQIENYLLSLVPALLNAIITQFLTTARGPAPIDLKMTSGIPGILLVLIKAHQKGLHAAEIKKIVRGEILKILSFRVDLDFSQRRYSIFPETVDQKSGDGLFGNALAWSRGDLNQSLLFYRANALFGDLDLKRMGDLVGLNTLLRRDEGNTNVTGSDFFSGASGLAQVYHYLSEASPNKAFREGHVFWTNKTVEFLARELPAGTYAGRELDVLHGLAGVALTLLTSRHQVKWSHCVLL